MHGSGSLFLFVCIGVCVICLLPLRLQLALEHETRWQGQVTLQILWLHGEKRFPAAKQQHTTTARREQRHMVQRIQWKTIAHLLGQACKVITRQLRLEQLSVHCWIGWQQADWTAYSYGLFWTAVSFLPPQWLARSKLSYVPDFQQERQEIALHGIICCRIGQIILILLLLIWLVIQTIREQKRKERIVCEG